MDTEGLSEHICAQLQILAPQINDASLLVEECLANARKYLTDDFIVMLSPLAWAKITLTYHKHFLDSGVDISIAEIITAVLRDSITTNRMDMVTLSLAQQAQEMNRSDASTPSLKVVKE